MINIWTDIEYLQVEVDKFIADKNIIDLDTKRTLINVTFSFSVEDFCQILVKQFELIFTKMIFENSLRINFKNDILNGLFLLHVN